MEHLVYCPLVDTFFLADLLHSFADSFLKEFEYQVIEIVSELCIIGIAPRESFDQMQLNGVKGVFQFHIMNNFSV